MRNVLVKNCRGNQNTHFMINNSFSENRAVYEIMWKNIAQRGGPQMKIWRIACWIPEATNTHSFRIRNTYYFSTTTMVTLTHVSVTLCPHYLSCCYLLTTRSYFSIITRYVVAVPQTQQPATCPYLQPDQPIPCPHIPLINPHPANVENMVSS